MKKLLRFLGFFVGIILLIYIAYQIWLYFAPRKPEVPQARKDIARQICMTIANDLRKNRGDITTIQVLHFENDYSGFITEELRRQLEYQGFFAVVAKDPYEKIRDFLHLQHPGYSDQRDAIRIARIRGAQGVVFGKIDAFGIAVNDVILNMEVAFWDVNAEHGIFTKSYDTKEEIGEPANIIRTRRLTLGSLAKNLILWVLVFVLLPLLTFPFIRAAVRKNSNNANAQTLILYSAIDTLWFFILFSIVFSGWLLIIFVIAAAIIAFIYNTYIMSFAVKLEES